MPLFTLTTIYQFTFRYQTCQWIVFQIIMQCNKKRNINYQNNKFNFSESTFSVFVFMLTFSTNRHVSDCLPWLSGLLQIFVEVMQIRKLLGYSPGFMLTLSCICFLTGLKSWTCVSVTIHLSNARARKTSPIGLNVRSLRIHVNKIKSL